jgi:hypothetical protein
LHFELDKKLVLKVVFESYPENFSTYTVGIKEENKCNMGGTHPPKHKKLAIHPLAQSGVFWLNCFESPAKRDIT